MIQLQQLCTQHHFDVEISMLINTFVKSIILIYEIIPCATYITVNQNNDNSNIDRKQIIIFLV